MSVLNNAPNKEWYKSWFNTPYYHLLYHNRNWAEAQNFVDALLLFLNLPAPARVLDVACGRGRHAHRISEHGHYVWGTDLSEANIEYAKQFEDERLKFAQHDMRQVFKSKHFDLLTNLFTSFGYFDNDADNLAAISAFAANLKPDGRLIMDFLNAQKVRENLIAEEFNQFENATFRIKRRIDAHFVFKDIEFEDEKGKQFFSERVRLLELADFEILFERAGLHILHTFGDYSLRHPYSPEKAERLILVAGNL